MRTKAVTLLPLLATCVFLSAACAPPAAPPPAEALPTDTPAPVSTATPEPTSTPQPTDTPTPTPQPTSTPTPTPVPTPTPFPASAFSVQVVGYGEHGAMIEVNYAGDWSDLEGQLLQVATYQTADLIDTQQVQLLGRRNLAEMVDAKYKLGEIRIELWVSDGATSEAMNVVPLDVIDYAEHHPFIHPMFHQSELPPYPLDIVEVHEVWNGEPDPSLPDGSVWYAKDFCSRKCSGNRDEGHFDTIGTPVHMPFSINLIRIGSGDDSIEFYERNIIFEHPYTGYIFLMSHQYPGEILLDVIGDQDLDGFGQGYPPRDDELFIPYDSERVFTIWGQPWSADMVPHLHFEGQIPLAWFRDVIPERYYDAYWGYSFGEETGNPRYQNCLPEQEYGPCIPKTTNISLERYLLDGWIDPSR